MSPVKITRDEFGLIEGITYVFKDNGKRVDWRGMIPAEYLVPNRQNFERRKEAIPDNIKGVADKDLLILLDGIKYIADLRGYISSVPKKIESSPLHCTVAWEIQWLPNFETEGYLKFSGGIGDATQENTNGFGRKFLGPIAENRAFVRNVRNFLRIPILGKDEVDGVSTTNEPEPESASENKEKDVKQLRAELAKLIKKTKISFEMIKEKLVSENVDGAADYVDVNSLPVPVLFMMIERLQKKKNT